MPTSDIEYISVLKVLNLWSYNTVFICKTSRCSVTIHCNLILPDICAYALNISISILSNIFFISVFVLSSQNHDGLMMRYLFTHLHYRFLSHNTFWFNMMNSIRIIIIQIHHVSYDREYCFFSTKHFITISKCAFCSEYFFWAFPRSILNGFEDFDSCNLTFP